MAIKHLPDHERHLESYPKSQDDPSLDAQMELVRNDDGELIYRFKDTGLRLEIDGEEYVPGPIAPTHGHVVFKKKGSNDGMVTETDLDVKIHVDMTAPTQATGGDHQ